MAITKIAKLAKAFETGSTITSKQIQTVYGLKSPQKTVCELRRSGMCIYTNRDGYRLGKPTKRMVSLALAVGGSHLFQDR